MAVDWIMSTTDDATGLAIPLISIIDPGAEIGVGVQFMLRLFVKTETGEWCGGRGYGGSALALDGGDKASCEWRNHEQEY